MEVITDSCTEFYQQRVMESANKHFGRQPVWVRFEYVMGKYLRYLAVLDRPGLISHVAFPTRDGKIKWRQMGSGRVASPAKWRIEASQVAG